MGWGRMDDGFDDHPKVVAILDEDDTPSAAAAIALWTLCFTWAHRNTRKRGKTPGLLPAGLPRRFLGTLGKDGAQLLVKHGLWEPQDDGGWIIHDFGDYLPNEDTRAARSEAGKRGAEKRWAEKHAAEAAEAEMANCHDEDGNLPSASHDAASKPVANDGSRTRARRDPTPTPVPTPMFASDEANAPSAGDASSPRPKRARTDPDAPKRADAIVAAFIDAGRAAEHDEPTKAIIGKVARDAKRLLAEGIDPDKLLLAAERMGKGGWNSLDIQLQRLSAERVAAQSATGNAVAVRGDSRPSTSDQRAAAALAAGQRLQAQFEGKAS